MDRSAYDGSASSNKTDDSCPASSLPSSRQLLYTSFASSLKITLVFSPVAVALR